MTTVLLTGAAGFVGRQILSSLLMRDCEVRVVVRISGVDRMQKQLPAESIIETPDLFAESSRWWSEVCQDVDMIIHSAWYAEPGKYLQSDKNIDCLIGTLAMARGALEAGVKRVVGIGTCFEYDLKYGYLSINTPLNPLTPYAATKASVYMILSKWFERSVCDFLWCRLFYLYGEGEDERRLIPYIRSKLAAGEVANLTCGEQTRDFLDVKVAAQMIVEQSMSQAHGAVNICSGNPVTVKQLAELIANEYGREDLLNFCARPDNEVDPPFVVGVA